jgi:hypothetical protein
MYVDHWGEIHPPSPPGPEKKKPLTPESLAAKGVGVPELADIGQKLCRYGTAKARNRAMAGFLASLGTRATNDPLRKLSANLYACASTLGFRHYLEAKQTLLHSGMFCKAHLLCPVCAIRRGVKTLQKYHQRAVHLADAFDFYLVTLTVKNGDDLAERHRHLKNAFKRLRTRGRDGYGEWSRVAGAVWSTEFTFSAESGWHPHLHVLVALPKGEPPIRYGQGSQLALDWLAVTGDSFIVHSARIKGEADDLADSLCEVLKYALKFADLPLEKNWDAYLALRGKRLLQSSGCFFGLDVPPGDDLLDELLHGPYVDFWFKYGSTGYLLTPEPQGTFHTNQ